VKTLGETSFNFVSADRGTWTLKNLDDYVTATKARRRRRISDAPIVFVGYGIKAPEYGWDDYKGVDLKGKVALLFVNEPISDDPKFSKQGADVLRTMELQIRRDSPARSVGHTDHSPDDLASYGWQVVRNSGGTKSRI